MISIYKNQVGTLTFKNEEDRYFLNTHIITREKSLKAKDFLPSHQHALLIQFHLDVSNPHLDLEGIGQYKILLFDENDHFTGTSISLGTAQDSFEITSEACYYLILPFNYVLDPEELVSIQSDYDNWNQGFEERNGMPFSGGDIEFEV